MMGRCILDPGPGSRWLWFSGTNFVWLALDGVGGIFLVITLGTLPISSNWLAITRRTSLPTVFKGTVAVRVKNWPKNSHMWNRTHDSWISWPAEVWTITPFVVKRCGHYTMQSPFFRADDCCSLKSCYLKKSFLLGMRQKCNHCPTVRMFFCSLQ
jgi:hypothetical protein